MDNPNPSNPGFSTDPSLNIQNVGQQVQNSQLGGVVGGQPQNGVTTETSTKRRPGRPKGSTKKNLLGAVPPPSKIKRPVGRPRKDGMPAGSLGPGRSRAKRERAQSQVRLAHSIQRRTIF